MARKKRRGSKVTLESNRPRLRRGRTHRPSTPDESGLLLRAITRQIDW